MFCHQEALVLNAVRIFWGWGEGRAEVRGAETSNYFLLFLLSEQAESLEPHLHLHPCLSHDLCVAEEAYNISAVTIY